MTRMRVMLMAFCMMYCIGWTLTVFAAKYAPLVEKAQKRLIELEYFSGTADGKMGPKTQEAIKKFQQDNGLSVTGELDQVTLEKLEITTIENSSEVPQSSPAPEATSSPQSSDQPVTGIAGLPPLSGGEWQLTLEKVHVEKSIKHGNYPNEITFTPKEGFSFLVIDVMVKNLDLSQPINLTLSNMALVDANGKIHPADGGGWSTTIMCAGCGVTFSRKVGDESLTGIMGIKTGGDNISVTVGELNDNPLSFAFILPTEQLNQNWKIQFQNVPPIMFSLSQGVQHQFTTKLSANQSALPSGCQVKILKSQDNNGQLIYQRWEDGRVILGTMALDGSTKNSCAKIASGNIQYANDGTILLKIDTLEKGWSNLFVINGKNKITQLVQNGRKIQAVLDPSGQYTIFQIQQLGKKTEELYIYDQKTNMTTLLKEYRWGDFRLLANNRLLAIVPKANGWGREGYIGQLGSNSLTLVTLPEDAEPKDIALDGEHLLYRTNQRLIFSKLDGSEQTIIAKSASYRLEGVLSPNNQFVLFHLPANEDKGEKVGKIGLFNLTTRQSIDVMPNNDKVSFKFSADSQWAVVGITIKKEGIAGDIVKRTWSIINTNDGKIVQTLENALNVYFAPDSTRIAYTLLQANGTLEMFSMTLSDGKTASLGKGMLLGWNPIQALP